MTAPTSARALRVFFNAKDFGSMEVALRRQRPADIIALGRGLSEGRRSDCPARRAAVG